MQKVNKNDIRIWSEDSGKRPAPEKGKIWSDTAGSTLFTLRSVYGKPLQSVMDQHTEE